MRLSVYPPIYFDYPPINFVIHTTHSENLFHLSQMCCVKNLYHTIRKRGKPREEEISLIKNCCLCFQAVNQCALLASSCDDSWPKIYHTKMHIDLIMQLTLKLSKCGNCADAVHLRKMFTRYDVSISNRLSQMSVLKFMIFCVCEIGRFYLDYTGFVCSFVNNRFIWVKCSRVMT